MIALCDANVLYRAPVRNLLMYLAVGGLFQARWSDEIHEEWIRALLEHRPDLDRAKLNRTRALMDQNVVDALVTGYEPSIGRLELPDPNDRHVLAAAIRCDADVIITMNLKDFPARALRPYGIAARHPDDFICELFRHAPAETTTAATEHLASLKNPPKNVADYLGTLRQQGLRNTAAMLARSMGHTPSPSR